MSLSSMGRDRNSGKNSSFIAETAFPWLAYLCRIMASEPVRILEKKKFALTLDRLGHQVVEAYKDPRELVLLGIQPRGILLSRYLHRSLKGILEKQELPYGELDITFFRDDIRRRDDPPMPEHTSIDLDIEDRDVVLVDDVLYTGRTIRAAMDALLAYGRPRSVELLVLVDRRFKRHLPIQPDITGIKVDTVEHERVKVSWTEGGEPEEVLLYSSKEGE